LVGAEVTTMTIRDHEFQRPVLAVVEGFVLLLHLF
jgi:hypothetical protein